MSSGSRAHYAVLASQKVQNRTVIVRRGSPPAQGLFCRWWRYDKDLRWFEPSWSR